MKEAINTTGQFYFAVFDQFSTGAYTLFNESSVSL